MSIRCALLSPEAEPAWDAFVTAHPLGTFFHLAGWRAVIARAFGHATQYIVAERDGAIVGVLPMGQVKTALFGNSLISVPFTVAGGPLVAEPEAAMALQSYAADLMGKLGAPVMEWRFMQAPEWLDPAEFVAGPDLYVVFRKPITGVDDDNLKAIPRKQRAMVRKGIDSTLHSVVETDVGRLHAIYAESVRNLGTPVHARRTFEIIMEVFADRADIVTICDGDAAIASVMNFYFRDEVLPYYGGGRFVARDRHANDFMYWEVMRRAAARGYRMFDFGRSKRGTEAFAFKKNWGFVAEPLHYRFRLAPGQTIPELNPLNPKYRMFIAAWKRLPVPVANVIGPLLVRGLG